MGNISSECVLTLAGATLRHRMGHHLSVRCSRQRTPHSGNAEMEIHAFSVLSTIPFQCGNRPSLSKLASTRLERAC